MKKMRSWLLVAAMGFFGVSLHAQSNTLLVYGSVSFDSQNANKVQINSYSIAPAVGYQWNDHWTAGINLALSGTKESVNSSSVSVGPFLRYTQPLAGPFAIYGQFNANVLSGNSANTSYTGFQAMLFPAIGVNLKNSFALNFSFGALSLTSQTVKGLPDAQTNFHLGFGSGASFGISKNFGL